MQIRSGPTLIIMEEDKKGLIEPLTTCPAPQIVTSEKILRSSSLFILAYCIFYTYDDLLPLLCLMMSTDIFTY